MKKFLQNIMIFLLLISNACGSYKNSYWNKEDKEKVAYNDGNDFCLLFKSRNLSHYNPKKCLYIKFGISQDEYHQLKKLYLQATKENRIYPRKNPIIVWRDKKQCDYYVTPVIYKIGDTLVTKSFYGLYYVSGCNLISPYIYTLRTEKGFFYSNCKGKHKLINELNSSKLITDSLKKKNKFIYKL